MSCWKEYFELFARERPSPKFLFQAVLVAVVVAVVAWAPIVGFVIHRHHQTEDVVAEAVVIDAASVPVAAATDSASPDDAAAACSWNAAETSSDSLLQRERQLPSSDLRLGPKDQTTSAAFVKGAVATDLVAIASFVAVAADGDTDVAVAMSQIR
jgi:hypothetical protein